PALRAGRRLPRTGDGRGPAPPVRRQAAPPHGLRRGALVPLRRRADDRAPRHRPALPRRARSAARARDRRAPQRRRALAVLPTDVVDRVRDVMGLRDECGAADNHTTSEALMHRNAPLTPEGRRRLCELIDSGWTVAAAAESMRISRQCAHKWWRRYRVDGV